MEGKKNERKDLIEEIPRECPECGGRIIHDEERGEYYCQDCGLVVSEEEFQQLPEWRAFTPEQKIERPRAGPPLKPGEKITTVITGTKDAYGRSISTKEREVICRMRKWHRRVTPHRFSKIPYADITKLSINLRLPREVKDFSVQIYKKCLEKDLVKGRDKKVVVAATVYTSLRYFSIPMPLDSIAKISGIEQKLIGRMFREIVKEMGLHIIPIQASDYIGKFSEELGLSEAVKSRAMRIFSEVKEIGIDSGKSPTSLAAAIIYIAAIEEGERRTQREIAEIAGVTEVTIRNRFKEIESLLNLKICSF